MGLDFPSSILVASEALDALRKLERCWSKARVALDMRTPFQRMTRSFLWLSMATRGPMCGLSDLKGRELVTLLPDECHTMDHRSDLREGSSYQLPAEASALHVSKIREL